MEKEQDIFEKAGIFVPSTQFADVKDVIPSGILPLDLCLNTGGVARGRFAAFVGIPSIGKSTIVAYLARNNILAGGTSIIFDTEDTYELDRLERLGITKELQKKLIVINSWGNDKKSGLLKPLTVETIGTWLTKLLRVAQKSDKLAIFWDTISSTPVDKELEEDFDHEKLMGKHSRELSYFFRLIPSLLLESQSTLVAVLQPKTDPLAYGSTTYIGEKVIKFHASQIIMMQKYSQDENKIVVKATVTKNKVATAYKTAQISYFIKEGVFDAISSIPEFVSGNGYSFGKTKVTSRKEFNKILIAEKENIEQWVTNKLEKKIPYKLYINEAINQEITEQDEIEQETFEQETLEET
ncbi:MAG: hypothetical protein QXU98_13730 [Candidatus Parvarchaeota archaeon]